MKTFQEYLIEESSRKEAMKGQDERKRADKDVGQGIFTMAFVTKIENMDLEEAKKQAMNIISSNTKAKPGNIDKAEYMVKSSSTIPGLMKGISDFILKYGGLGVMK